MIHGVDVSRWQPSVNWATLKANGVEFVFIKATQGNYTVDTMLRSHVEGANAAGLIVGLYHWCDPLVNAESQALYFVNNTRGLKFHMVAADVEQFWADWQEWSSGNITKYISPDAISNNARTILNVWKQELNVPAVLYSRASFIHGFARPMLNWVCQWPLWMAHYPYAPGRIQTTWEVFKTQYRPSIAGPSMPTGCTNWTFWQFTGDKFILPGVTTALDVNYFNGDLAQLRQFVKLDTTPPPPLTLEQRVARLEQEARSRGWNV